ncbi:winged helix-turn-helix domain-containing protein [Nonomuraea sp. NPDC049695]|uniref:ArsR/SmtB family transcription factor n=1 Tax=Nonomuraea sp. NPDC049695 TaxID=3154734 RepID=UPI00342CE1D1
MGTKRRPATEAEARALASAVRLRILRLCLDQALTNKEIAGRLDANPATTLHHVRKLVQTGFLAAEPSRPGPRGSTEIPYRATGKSWEMDVRESGVTGGSAAMLDAFLEEARLVDLEEANLTRLGLRLTEDEHAELRRRLQELFDEFRERRPEPGGQAYSLFLAIHRDASRDA